MNIQAEFEAANALVDLSRAPVLHGKTINISKRASLLRQVLRDSYRLARKRSDEGKHIPLLDRTIPSHYVIVMWAYEWSAVIEEYKHLSGDYAMDGIY